MYPETAMEPEISVEDLNKKLKESPPQTSREEFCLLDVREPWEAATASISGSHLMPMGDIPSRAHRELDPDAHIVVYCHRGNRSLSVTFWLREQGFSKAQSLAGGIDAWSQRIDPSIERY